MWECSFSRLKSLFRWTWQVPPRPSRANETTCTGKTYVDSLLFYILRYAHVVRVNNPVFMPVYLCEGMT